MLRGCLRGFVILVVLLLGAAMFQALINNGTPSSSTTTRTVPAKSPVVAETPAQTAKSRAKELLNAAANIAGTDLLSGMTSVEMVGSRLGVLQAWASFGRSAWHD